MGFFNHNGEVSVDVLAQEVSLCSAESPVRFGNAEYDTSKYPTRSDFPDRKLFELGRGVHGSQNRVLGERLGIIDYGNSREDLRAQVAIVAVPVRDSGFFSRYVDIAVRHEDVALYSQALDPSKFCRHAIARAVLTAANGVENK